MPGSLNGYASDANALYPEIKLLHLCLKFARSAPYAAPEVYELTAFQNKGIGYVRNISIRIDLNTGSEPYPAILN